MFLRNNTQNYPICDNCKIQANFFHKTTGVSLYLSRQLHKNWQIVRKRAQILAKNIATYWCKRFDKCMSAYYMFQVNRYILKAAAFFHLLNNGIVFPVGKNRPGMESVAVPLNICFQRKEKQFSNFHQTRHVKIMTSRVDGYQKYHQRWR